MGGVRDECTYEDLEAFYRAAPERRRSGEADYEAYWTEGGARWPRWRVSYVQATGEVYAVELGGPERSRVAVLGVVQPDEDDGRRRAYYRTLDRLLEGWAEEPYKPLDRVQERLQSAQRRHGGKAL